MSIERYSSILAPMVITVLGSGTSNGIPVPGCECSVCKSELPENKRTRTSIMIQYNNKTILVDVATEFRLQAVRENIKQIDSVLITHGHSDHIQGIDDLRPYCRNNAIPFYGNRWSLKEIKIRYGYIFKKSLQKGGGKPSITLNRISTPFMIGDREIIPIPLMHGALKILGYRIGNFSYITDCSRIPEKSWKLLSGTETLIINALRYRPHETHFSLDETLEVIKKIRPRRAFLIHMCHDLDHKKLTDSLPECIEPAFDGLQISI